MKFVNIQFLILRLALAVFFLHEGIGKISDGWLLDSAPLVKQLKSFDEDAVGYHKQYLERVAIPHANIWSRAIPLGEAAVGLSMLLGLLVRLSAFCGILMILNLHAANGFLWSFQFFFISSAIMLFSILLVVLIAGAGRWMGIDAVIAKKRPRGFLW
ncbi:MAG TPA: DoxX family protein [Bacteroidota bacterium]|nr:DoxX family protein [Bacteroidota bacterium]